MRDEDKYFNDFISRLNDIISNKESLSDLQKAELLHEIDSFFYQSFGDDDFISRFHAFWGKKCEDVIGFRIDKNRCFKVAQSLENVYKISKKIVIRPNIEGLNEREIVNARYYTVAQDWKFNISEKIYEVPRINPDLVDAKKILANPEKSTDEFLRILGVQDQPQKRRDYYINLAALAVEKFDGDAYNINEYCDRDYKKIYQALIEEPENIGYSDKKLNLFLRDMIDLGIWTIKNPELIDVPSDINTMNVALRTGILKTNIPLVSSYMDVFGIQYALTDGWNQLAWREVWKQWGSIPDNHRPPAPVFFDKIIFEIGRNCCKTVLYRCDDCGEEFVASSRKQTCISCGSRNIKNISQPPCFKNSHFGKCNRDTCKLRDEIVGFCNDKCFLDDSCEKNIRNAPRAISIRGGTGWEDGITDEGGGGGITA